MTKLRLHARQFVVARAPYYIGEDWVVTPLGEGWTLSHDPQLPVASTDDGLILGYRTARAAGRYCTLAYPTITTDAGALLSLYYGRGEHGDFVTSSPAIAAQLGAQSDPSSHRPRFGGMDWQPMPGSSLRGVRRLLRDQMLDLRSFTASFRPDAVIVPFDSEAEALDTLCETLVATATEVATQGRLVLGLTAGVDSRTVLAALIASGVPLSCITQIIPNASNARDIGVARDICRYVGLKHDVIGGGVRDDNAVDAWQQHTLGSYDDADNRSLFRNDLYRFVTSETVLVRAGVFEIGRHTYSWLRMTLETASADAVFRGFERTKEPTPVALETLQSWLDWRRAYDNGLDLPDTCYLDQRVGGWQSAIEQAMDLLPGRNFQPANTLPVMRALQTPPPADRKVTRLQRQAISRLAPGLMRFPVNPPRASLMRRIRTRIAHARLTNEPGNGSVHPPLTGLRPAPGHS